jgi:uncharacterized protein (TIGR03083 family)
MLPLDLAYAETKAALLAALADAGEAAWDRSVPATPAWRVRDVVAHVTGIAVDGASGTFIPGLNLLEQFRDDSVVRARDAYADETVESRRGQAWGDVLAEWDAAEPQLLARLSAGCPPDNRFALGLDVVTVTDLCVHTDDVAGALALPPRKGSAAAGVALAGYCFGVDYRIRALGLPALAVRYDRRERVPGPGDAAITVTGDRWEVLRALAGRRSRDQIRELDWSGDPEPYLPLLPAYGERTEPLIETG